MTRNLDVDPEVVDVDPEETGSPFAGLMRQPKALADPFDHFKKMVQLSNQLQRLSIAETKPQDWLVMGDKLYLQSTGTERSMKLVQLVMGTPIAERENYPDGTFAYTYSGKMASRLLGCVIDVEGGRWSGDEFFDKFSEPRPDRFFKDVGDEKRMTEGERLEWRLTHRLPVDPTEVKKAAHTNWRNRGISTLCGLRGLTPKDLAGYGFDVSGIVKIGFDAGGKGGKATSMKAPEKFGPEGARGKPIAEIDDAAIRFYIVAANKNINDPMKSRWKQKEQAWLDALLAEQAGRDEDRASKAAPAAPKEAE